MPWKGSCRLHGGAKERLADPAWIDVVEIKVQLRDHANVGPALPVDWNKGFDAELKGVSDPDEPGIDGPGRHGSRREGIRHRRLQCCFNQRDETDDEIRQPEDYYGGLQKRHSDLT